MFHIKVILDTAGDSTLSVWKHGLEAVDFCRKYGLEPMACIQIKCSDSRLIKVSEGFARAFFENPSKIEDSETITLDMLIPGELVAGGQCITLKADLTNERIVELYHAGARKRLLDVIAEHEETIKKLEKPSQD